METCVISMLIGAIIAFLVCIAIQWAVGLVFSQVPMQILRKEHAGNITTGFQPTASTGRRQPNQPPKAP